MSEKIRVLLNSTKPHLEFAADVVRVYDGMKDNPSFEKPPIPLDTVKATLDAYTSAISNAAEGGKKAVIERNRLKGTLAQMMRQLGHWVEAVSNGNLATFKSSGFQTVSTTRVAAGPLPPPLILKIENGASSGVLLVTMRPIPKARSYELRCAAIGADGKPGEWKSLPPYTDSRSMSVNGLTPGTLYAFQARALGKLGYTDWSDAANRMSL
jgi:hypothetical protein